MGESFGVWQMGTDHAIMPYIDMANIACGYHASDPQVMNTTVALAKKHQVTIGAHPGYPDLLHFGRKNMALQPDEITHMVLYQVGALQAICHYNGVSLDYIKPHGALYNTMMREHAAYVAIVKAASCLNMPLVIAAQRNTTEYISTAERYGVALLFEVFCDRAYDDQGQLVSRDVAGSVHQDIGTITAQAKQLASHSVTTIDNTQIQLKADTICIHGDGALALDAAQSIHALLNK